MTDRSKAKLILASTSAIRKVLLSRFDVPFNAVSPDYAEVDLGMAPRNEAIARAVGKATSVAPAHPDTHIVGSDQLLVFKGRKRSKPLTSGQTFDLLMEMREESHQLFTGVCIHHPPSNRTLRRVVVSTLRIREDLSSEEIQAYVDADNPVGCAGGYKLESRGIALFSKISTPDYTAILGLPLMALTDMLRRLGISVFKKAQ